MSVSNDLKYDAERDLKDIGASKIEVRNLSMLNCVNSVPLSEYLSFNFVMNIIIEARILQ